MESPTPPGPPERPLGLWPRAVPDDPGADMTGPSPAPAGGEDWTAVYMRERDGLVRLAYLMTGSAAVAEDLVQDCFIRVMAKLSAEAGPGPYLRRSVINACYSWQRRAWREVRAEDDRDGRGGDRADPYRDRNRPAADQRERFTDGTDIEMWDALNRLPARRRAVLVMRFYMDMSEAEIAATLDCRVGTVKSTCARGLEQLRKMIQK